MMMGKLVWSLCLIVVLFFTQGARGGDTVCNCAESPGGICIQNVIVATSQPDSLWACDVINGTLLIEFSGQTTSNKVSKSMFVNWMYGDIIFNVDSTVKVPSLEVAFPFIDGLVGSLSFNLAKNFTGTLVVDMGPSLGCWTSPSGPSGTLMNVDGDSFKNVALSMQGQSLNSFNATGVIRVKNKGMMYLGAVSITRLSSLIVEDTDNPVPIYNGYMFGKLTEITNTLSINGVSGSTVNWFPKLLSVGSLILKNNSAAIQLPKVQKLSSSLEISGNTGVISINVATSSGYPNSNANCSCLTGNNGTTIVSNCYGNASWIFGSVTTLCKGNGYKPTAHPICPTKAGNNDNGNDDDHHSQPGPGNPVALAAWLIAVIIIASICFCCIIIVVPVFCCAGTFSAPATLVVGGAVAGAAAGATLAANSNQQQSTTTRYVVPSSVATVASPMAPQGSTYSYGPYKEPSGGYPTATTAVNPSAPPEVTAVTVDPVPPPIIRQQELAPPPPTYEESVYGSGANGPPPV